MNEREILDRVRADGLLVAGRPVLVLLSGGRDSVCLLDVAVGLAHRRQVGLGLDDQVVRPEATQRDRVCDVGQLEREREVVRRDGHGQNPACPTYP